MVLPWAHHPYPKEVPMSLFFTEVRMVRDGIMGVVNINNPYTSEALHRLPW